MSKVNLKLVDDDTYNEAFFEKSPKTRTRSKRNKNPTTNVKQEQSVHYTKNLKARTEGQARLLSALEDNSIVFVTGCAGTGKTYLTVSKALRDLEQGKVKKIIFSRPAVEAGEKLGFLPGSPTEKVDPYMRPIYDVCSERVSPSKFKKWLEDGTIEIAPLAFMRGRTLKNCAIILDEAQNATYTQLKMLLTRLGLNSYITFCGDLEQYDLPEGQSGLKTIINNLEGKDIKGLNVVRLTDKDIIRHPILKEVVKHL
jgi:phosphate starvation-inducible PhoH-like protein